MTHRRRISTLRQVQKRRAVPVPMGRWSRVKTFLRGFEHVVLVATFISIIIGVVAFVIDYEDRKQARLVNKETLAEIAEAREDRRDDAITRAWSLVTTPAVGNSGKGPALEYLHSQGVSLTGIDLSCETMGGQDNWDQDRNECNSPTYLSGARFEMNGNLGVDLSNANLKAAILQNTLFQNADLARVNFESSDLTNTTFSDTNLLKANFVRSNLEGINFTDVHVGSDKSELLGVLFTSAVLRHSVFNNLEIHDTEFSFADLENASLRESVISQTEFIDTNLTLTQFQWAEVNDTSFYHAQLSSANFSGADIAESVSFNRAWAWEDMPPIGLHSPRYKITLCLFDPAIHNRSRKPDPCIPPSP